MSTNSLTKTITTEFRKNGRKPNAELKLNKKQIKIFPNLATFRTRKQLQARTEKTVFKKITLQAFINTI